MPQELLEAHKEWLQHNQTQLLLRGLNRRRLQFLEQAAKDSDQPGDTEIPLTALRKAQRIKLIIEDIKNGQSDIWK